MTDSAAPTTVPCIVDDSVLSRIAVGEIPPAALDPYVHDEYVLATCTPHLLEALYSARSPKEWADDYRMRWSLLTVLHADRETHAIAVELQRRLWNSGNVRAAGPVDTMIAAIAIQHGAIVVHRDSDYERIAEVAPEFRQVRV